MNGMTTKQAMYAATAVGMACVLASCAAQGSGTDTETPENTGTERVLPEGEEPSGSFAEVLGSTSVVPPRFRERINIYYGNQARLRELAVEDPRWSDMSGYGLGEAGTVQPREELSEFLDIDTLSADTLYRVGHSDRALYLVEGNQDAGAVAAAAESNGWEQDGDTLVHVSDDADFYVGRLYATHLRLTDDAGGGSVLMSPSGADMDRFDGEEPTLLDDDEFAAVTGCLGDPVAARIIDTRNMPWLREDDANPVDGQVALGVFPGETIQTVMCVISDEPQRLAEGIEKDVKNEPLNQLEESPRSKRISGVEVTVDGHLVRAVFDHGDGVAPNAVTDFIHSPLGIPGLR